MISRIIKINRKYVFKTVKESAEESNLDYVPLSYVRTSMSDKKRPDHLIK